jgi:hypothetical protein
VIPTCHGLNPYPAHLPLNPNCYRPPRAQEKEREVQARRRPPGPQIQKVPIRWLPVRRRAELEACEVCPAQGQRIRVWPVVTLPKPEFVIFSSAEVS